MGEGQNKDSNRHIFYCLSFNAKHNRFFPLIKMEKVEH